MKLTRILLATTIHPVPVWWNLAATFAQTDKRVLVSLSGPAKIVAGQSLEILVGIFSINPHRSSGIQTPTQFIKNQGEQGSGSNRATPSLYRNLDEPDKQNPLETIS